MKRTTTTPFTGAPDTLPPCNIEAEEAVLGGILLDPAAIGMVADILQPDAFYHAAHREVYRTALLLHGQGKATTLTAMAAWLTDTGKLQRIGGSGWLAELLDRTITSAGIRETAGLVADKHRRRVLMETCRQIIETAADSSHPLAETLGTLAQAAADLGNAVSPQGLERVDAAVGQAMAEIRDRADGTTPAGIPTGFYDFDDITQGLQRTDLIIVAGRPSMGKTAISVNVATNIAQLGLPVAVFSLETSQVQLAYRMLSAQAGIGASTMRAGRLGAEQWDRLADAGQAVAGLPLWLNDRSVGTVADIRAQCQRLQAEQGPLGLVMIDYLQLMTGGGDNRNNEISTITRGLKGIARDLKVPVMALSQLSRGVETRNNKRPMLSDLRDSGSIEQDADLVCMVYRDEYYNPDTIDKGITELLVAKHRNGAVGTVKLLFQPQFTKFRSIAAA